MVDPTEHASPARPPSQRISARLSGRQIGPYELLALLGQGSMGAVYLAEHAETEARVALKLMGGHLLDDEESMRRFQLELAALVKLRHPNVIGVHDAGRMPDGRPWYAMDYVEGETLRDAQRRGIDLEQGLDVLEQMARALGHAHEQGLVHRDFKPENVLIDPEGVPLLTDFGLARGVEHDDRLTRTGEILGTPRYMAPEQVSAKLGAVGPWSDTWGLGAVLYELLTGRTPYMGSTAVECFAQLTEGLPIPAPRELVPDVDPALEAVCQRALSRRPEERYPHGEAFAAALAAARSGEVGGEGPGRTLVVAASIACVSSLLCVAALLWVLMRAPAQAGTGARGDLAGRRAEVEQAWQAGDTLRARQILGQDVDHPARAWILALAGDAKQVDANLGLSVPPADRAWIAALAGDAGACERALVMLPDRAMARALAWQLLPLVPELTCERRAGDGLEGPGGWESQALGEELLATGRVPLAALAFGAAERGAGTDTSLHIAARLGLGRTSLARGDVAAAAAHLAKAVQQLEGSSSPTPLERARVRAWEALLGALARPGSVQEAAVAQAAQQERVARLARSAPGLPEAAWAVWLAAGGAGDPPQPYRMIGRARAEAARGDLLGAVRALGGEGERSFALLERAACARGADGPVGLLIDRGATLAELAARSGSVEGARRGRELLSLAAQLEPHSPAAWLSQATADLVLGEVVPARGALERATKLAPGDPWCHLLDGQTLLAELGERRRACDERRLDPEAGARAEVAREEQALAGELGRALEAYQAAAAGAAEGPLGVEARLRAGGVRLERLGLLRRARDAGAPAEQEALQRELGVALVDSSALAAALDRLGAALLREPNAPPLGEAERALSSLVGRRSFADLRALELLASAGSEPAGQLLRACARDLPARALLTIRRALTTQPGAILDRGLDRTALLAHARTLGPDLPAIKLACARQAGVGRDEASWVTLGEVVEEAPELTSAVLDLLRGAHDLASPAHVAEQLEQKGQPLAAALAWWVMAREDAGREARAARRVWLAATARLQQNPLRPCPAAHLLRALAFDAPPDELLLDGADDLLAVRAGAPWEWTAADRRLRGLPEGSDPALVQERLQDLLELGDLRRHRGLPTPVLEQLERGGGLEGRRQLAQVLRQNGLPRAALAVILGELTPQERTRGLPPGEVDPALAGLSPRRAAFAMLLRGNGRRDWEWGGDRDADRLRELALAARKALDVALPAGALPGLQPIDVRAPTGWVTLGLPGPGSPRVWDEGRRFLTLPTVLGPIDRWRFRGLARTALLGLQDPAVQGEQVQRYLGGARPQEAALAWSATLAFACDDDPQRALFQRGQWHLRPSGWSQGEEDERHERQLAAQLGYRLVQTNLEGQDVPGGEAVEALLTDLALDVVVQLPAGDSERARWAEIAGGHARSATPGKVAGEQESLSWWRLARARIGRGDREGALEAARRAFDTSRGMELREVLEGAREGWGDELSRAVIEAGGQELMSRLPQRGNQGWEGWREMLRGRRGRDGDGDRPR